MKSCQAAGGTSDGLALEASLAFPTGGSVGEEQETDSLLMPPDTGDTGDTGTGDKFEGSKAALLKCMAPSAALAASPLVSLSTFAASSHTTALVKAPWLVGSYTFLKSSVFSVRTVLCGF